MASAVLQAKQLIERIQREAPGITLYHAGDEFVVQQVFGIHYAIPPDGPGTHPHTGEFRKDWDGLLVVKDRYGVSKEARIAARENGTPERDIKPDVLLDSVQSIVGQLLVKLGQRGLVMVADDEKLNAKLRKEAHTTFVTYKRRIAEEAINQYHLRTKSFTEDPRNKGKLPPRMTDRELDLEAWLDELAEGNFDRKEFHCEFLCGFESDDEEKVQRHMRVRHAAEKAAAPIRIAPDEKGAAAGAAKGKNKGLEKVPK